MNRRIIGLVVAVVACGASTTWVHAESASYGFRASFLDWKEKKLYDERVSEDGVQFGPTLLFNFGQGDEYSIGFDAGYGSIGKLDRADFDLTFGYNFAPAFRLFADVRYLWQELDAAALESLDRETRTTGFGVGLGINASVPLGDSGFFAFGNMRAIPMRMKTDVSGSDGTSVLWAYEGGLAFSAYMDTMASQSSLFLAVGYRHQQMKGGDFDEQASMPFAEVGFKQEF